MVARRSAFTAEDVLEAFADVTSGSSVGWLDPDGFTFVDRAKQKERKRRWYLEHREAILEAKRAWRRNDPEASRRIGRRYHARHRDARNAAHRAYYQRNAERLRAARRSYYAARKAARSSSVPARERAA
jgi:hypothetical protein